MNGVSPRPVCQSRCCNPRASPNRIPVSASTIHNRRLRTDPATPAPAGPSSRRPRRYARSTGGVRIGGAAGRGLCTLITVSRRPFTAGDVFQQRLVPAATAMREPMQISTHVRAVEHVVVVAGDDRAQPHGDRLLGEPRRAALDRRDRRFVSGTQLRQKRAEALQRHRVPPQAERIQILPPQRRARAYDFTVFGDASCARRYSRYSAAGSTMR
jgi:hypothetical protein